MNAEQLKKLSDILYSENKSEVVKLVQSINSEDELFVLLDNYNWDNGFEVPEAIITHTNCTLSVALLALGTIYQFTPPTTYCIYENIKKDDFRFGSRLFNFNSCSLLKSCAFYIIVGNFQGQFFHLKTTV